MLKSLLNPHPQPYKVDIVIFILKMKETEAERSNTLPMITELVKVDLESEPERFDSRNSDF